MTKKRFIIFGILFFVLIIIFIPIHRVMAKIELPPMFNVDVKIGDLIVKAFSKFIAIVLMRITSWALIISGGIFDWVMKFTIFEMTKNIGGNVGVGAAIGSAWATLRDVANMFFIFVLLYAAFRTMFDNNFSNFNKTVRDIIIVALLINFSLFFSKVVIDASNIAAVGFYEAISTDVFSLGKSNYVGGEKNEFKSISGGYMKMLGIQTIFGSEILNPKDKNGETVPLDASQILIIGIASSAFMIVTAIILLMVSIMFVARFIILIFLIILSPLAFIAYIIPAYKDQFTNWRKALVDQSFFAPLYFAFTWVVFELGNALKEGLKTISGTDPQSDNFTNMFNNPKSSMALIVNYVLMIGFAVAALIFAKQMASRGATATAFSKITGGIGATALGGAAWLGRQSGGRWANKTLNDTDLRKSAAAGDKMARMKLATAEKLSKSSFDVRGVAGTSLGKAVGAERVMGVAGKAGGEGGFKKAVEEKAKRKAQYAKDVYGQTDEEKERASELEEEFNSANTRAKEAKEAEKNEAEKSEHEAGAKHEKAKSDAKAENEAVASELAAKEKAKEEAVLDETKKALDREIEEAKRKVLETKARHERILADAKLKHEEAIAKKKEIVENKKYSAETQKLDDDANVAKKILDHVKDAPKQRQLAYAERIARGPQLGPLGIRAIGRMQGNQASARIIRNQVRGPSKEKRLADAYKAIADSESKPAPEATPPATPAGGTGTP